MGVSFLSFILEPKMAEMLDPFFKDGRSQLPRPPSSTSIAQCNGLHSQAEFQK
ncbi:MAG: hypothetical protein Q9197_002909 [Variospora fuerteventurae]